MTGDEVRARLHHERNVWLCTVRSDGRPHVAPVWFVYVDGSFWIGTGADSVKARNIVDRPHASVAMEDGDRPVCAEGPATVHPTERPPAVVEAFMAKYGWDITRPEDADVGTVALVEVKAGYWLFGDPGGQ